MNQVEINESDQVNVQITFLGGLGTIGRNCLAIEHDGAILVVDCGILFPELRQLGVEIAIPDLSYLAERADSIVGVVITHGHEDHFGALQYLPSETTCPLYGSALTLRLVEKRLNGSRSKLILREVDDGAKVPIGPFTVEFIPVTHSVPWSYALAIQTPEGLILHTGDFKLDPDPIDNRRTDLSRIRELSRNPGIDLLLVDSTNADEPGRTGSERSVHTPLSAAMGDARGKRVITTCFASHLHRIAQIVDVAIAHGRTIVPIGRSLERSVDIAIELGILRIPESALSSAGNIDHLPDYATCIICTGSQGEPRSALALMSQREHRAVHLTDNDLVIISANAIPGNRSEVSRLLDNIARTGAEVIHAGMSQVHVSGHASREEIVEMLEAASPKQIIPVHGEYRHMIAARRLAAQHGIPKTNIHVCEDGDRVLLKTGDVARASRIPAPLVYVSSGGVDELTDDTLQQRRDASERGVLLLVISVDHAELSIRAIHAVEQLGWKRSELFAQELAGLESFVLGLRIPEDGTTEDRERYVRRKVTGYLRRNRSSAPNVVVLVVNTLDTVTGETR